MLRSLLLALLVTTTARAADLVHVGILNSLSDAPLFMAQDRGYFSAANIDIDIVAFDSGGKMIAPLGTGALDAGGGAPSAALYNAVERGIQLRIVADRITTDPVSNYQPILIRKALVESGTYQTLKDLKGLRIAIPAPGIAALSALNEAARAGGLTYNDIEKIYLAPSQQAAAFANAAIDGTIITEPLATIFNDSGAAVSVVNPDIFYPDQQAGVMFYSESFATQRHDVAQRFLTALLHADRDYVAATENGRIQGPGADAIIATLTRHFAITPDLARRLAPQHIHPDGHVNLESLTKDWQFFKDQNLIKGTVPPENVVDVRFADAANAELGAPGSQR